jgi:hypothetical protein
MQANRLSALQIHFLITPIILLDCIKISLKNTPIAEPKLVALPLVMTISNLPSSIPQDCLRENKIFERNI